MEKDLVSVVFPTMNRRDDLIKCIKSIKASTHKKIEIVVADNGSEDDTVKVVRKMFPDVVLITNDLNLGSPIAINNCIKASKGEFIFRLDDDVIIDKNTIEEMLKVLKSSPKIGAVTCLYFFTERPNILRTVSLKLNMFLGKTTTPHQNRPYHGEFENKLLDIKFAGGGSLLVRRSTYDEIGFYPESYFLCYEDLEWCHKLRKKGYRIVLVGSAKLWHKEVTSGKKINPMRVYLNNRSQVLFMKRNAGWRNIVFFPYLLLALYPAKAVLFLLKKNPEAANALTKGVFDALFRERVFVYTKDKKQVPYKK